MKNCVSHNLCDSCTYNYPDCPAHPNDIVFRCEVHGEDVKSDNVIICKEHKTEKSKQLRYLYSRAIVALKIILRNRNVGEYESQKQGLPRMIEANKFGTEAIKESVAIIGEIKL